MVITEAAKMNICLIANPGSAHTRRWVEYFIKIGHQVHLIGEQKSSNYLPDGCNYHELSSASKLGKYRYLWWGKEVKRIIKKIQPNILHSLGAVNYGWLGYLSGFHPHIITAMGSDINLLNKKPIEFRYITKIALRNANYVLCVSNQLAQKVKQYSISKDKIEVIYLGINIDIFHPTENKANIRKALGLPSFPTVLSVRAIDYIYNPLDIARSIPKIMNQIPQVSFIIFSYNQNITLMREFMELVTSYSCQQAVVIVPEISDDKTIAQYYQACDIGISIPSSDGTPISVLECMACETPLVVSDIPTIHDWVENEINGLIVPIGDIKGIADAIIRLLKNETLRTNMGKLARNIIVDRADYHSCMKRSEQIYINLTKQR